MDSQSLVIASQGLNNELNRRISLTTNDNIILSRESLPTGSLTNNNLTQSFLRYDNWNGPGVIILTDSNGDSAFKTESDQTILGARVVRTQEKSTLSPPKVEGAELFISDNDTTKVVKFNLDGTNSGIATYVGVDILGTSQIKSIELETGFDLNGNNTSGITVKSILYNPTELGAATGEQDRYVAETLDGEIVLSRETISTGSVVRGSNSNQNPIILKDNVGSPINSSVLNSESASKVLGARTIVFAPKGWQQEVVNDATSPVGYSVMLSQVPMPIQ